MGNIDVSTIETRTPVLDQESVKNFPNESIDNQWKLITEAVRRDILEEPKTRQALISFCTTPVSELLPNQLVTVIAASDPRIAKLANRYNLQIQAYLKLPAVPDELIKPDIRNAPSHIKPDEVIASFRELYSDDASLKERLQELADAGIFKKGLTMEERILIAKRYAFARDVKILALGAEICELGGVQPDSTGNIELPSGIHITLNTSNETQISDFLNPQLWEKRKQIKDRVYEVDINGKKYILKEKKTARHTDTKKHGHKESIPSSAEYSVARTLQEQTSSTNESVVLSWEDPVGYVTYPDGYSFTIFQYEEGLMSEDKIDAQLTSQICSSREQFTKEYQLVLQVADKFKDAPKVKRFGRDNGSTAKLTFEEYAMVKALRMKKQAIELLVNTTIANGYLNTDFDGYAFRIINNDQLQLQIIGFDFEYFSKVTNDEARARMNRHIQFVKDEEWRTGIGFMDWDNGTMVTRMQKAAYFALLEIEGI